VPFCINYYIYLQRYKKAFNPQRKKSSFVTIHN